jgi:hypothetical protein
MSEELRGHRKQYWNPNSRSIIHVGLNDWDGKGFR